MNYKKIQKKNQEILKRLNKKVRLYWSTKQETMVRSSQKEYYLCYAEVGNKKIYFSEQCYFPKVTSSKWDDMMYLGVFLKCQLKYKKIA